MIKTPITDSVSTSITATLIATSLENDSATGGSPASKVAGDPESFAEDSWATIKKAVHNGNTSMYNVGDKKTVTINGKDYTVRIANKTTGEHCGDNDTEYSQTACGFVVEFVDIITAMKMRDTRTNVGGYPATLVYDYLKNTLYGQLPSDLQAAIKPTRVISGHGCNGDWDNTNKVCGNPDNSGNNFTSTDNLYLLSGVELFGSDDYDTAAGTTHQLEYYVGKSNSDRIKQYNSSNSYWWLRLAGSGYNAGFRTVANYGGLDYYSSNESFGVAPAFRIG